MSDLLAHRRNTPWCAKCGHPDGHCDYATDGQRVQDNAEPTTLSTPEQPNQLLGRVVTGMGKRGNRVETEYITDQHGPRRFKSMSELRRAAFTQFGDDLNIIVEEL